MNGTEKLTDEEIVKMTRSENQELYAVIVDRYQAKLFRYVTGLIGDENKSIDAVQNSFIKAFVNLQGFNIHKKFSNWIYRIAHNEAMNIIKKYPKEMPLLDDIDSPSDENIEDTIAQREIVTMVAQCLKNIPIAYSEPLALHFIEEKSYEEISDILRIPAGTVATRIHRAKILMKRLCPKN